MTDPGGTPKWRSCGHESDPSMWTRCCLFEMYDLNHCNTVPEMPKCPCSRSKRVAWSIVSKAADRYNSVRAVTLPLSIMTCLSWLLWNASKRAHSVGVSSHVPMLYVSTRTIKALYSLRRSPSEMLRFLTHRDHSLWKASAGSCFLHVTSSTSPSNEPSLRVFHHCSTPRVFLLWMLVCSILDSLMMRCHFRRQPGVSRESCQTAGPIGPKFGTRIWIHLGMDIG